MRQIHVTDFKLRATPENEITKDILGGTMVVTGLKNNAEDNFLLDLINEQKMYNTIVVTSPDEVNSSQEFLKKRLLTRENKYSGLLDKLEIYPFLDLKDTTNVTDFLASTQANTWLAFNVDQSNVPTIAQLALDKGVKRLIVMIEVPEDKANVTSYPEFDAAETLFAQAGAAFTGVRHGVVVDGLEDNPYEIVNATVPLLEETVERGVLARVITELITVEDSFNSQCGVCSSSAFASAYLNILRSSGFTRQQEVRKLFQGGLQRVARLTVTEYEKQAVLKVEAAEKKALATAKEEEEKAKRALAGTKAVAEEPTTPTTLAVGVDFDDEVPEEVTEEMLVTERAQEILMQTWREYNARMYTKSTSKLDFFSKNNEMAMDLASKEFQAEKLTTEELEREKEATQRMLDKIDDINRQQYNKLLTLERQEMQNQKTISNTWVKYVFLLLAVTSKHCKDQGMLFNNMDEYQQTLLLREKANELRAMVGLPSYEVIYDPLDASAIVSSLDTLSIDADTVAMLSKNDEELLDSLDASYGKLLLSVAALRGASQIVQVAIETLQKDLPTQPPTVAELRAFESSTQQELRRKMKLDVTRNRGKPASATAQDSKVGRL